MGIARCGMLPVLIGLLWSGATAGSAEALEILLTAGEFDVEDGIGEGDPYEAGFGVRLDGLALLRWSWGSIVPALGVMANGDDAWYGWAGLAVPIPLGERWRLVPMVGAGAYERGKSRDLGGVFEFRSGLEVAVTPTERTAIGLEFYHLSNAGFHELNPGTNSLVLVFGFTP